MSLMTIVEVSAELHMSVRSVRNGWYDGTLPKPIRLGRRSIRWRRTDIESFLADQAGASRPEKEIAR